MLLRSLALATCAFSPLLAQDFVRVEDGKRYPIPVETAAEYLNPWTPEEEARFMEKAAHLIPLMAGQRMAGGSTVNEREKELYPKAFFKILNGQIEEGVEMLQQPQQYDPKEHHAYTDGFDFWYGFTVKGQMRKYFHFGSALDDDYRKRMEGAFAKWTQTDPRETPHPHYKKYNPKLQGWTPERFGNRQVDGRRTDNLYAMTTCATYLFAEAAGNEAVRQKSWERIRDYGVTMYMNGIGEWDSENYISHTMSAYINLYDFAEDPQVNLHAKGILDWISATMAVKYWRGGWAGAVKRDYGNIMVMEGNALKCGHLYFDDLGLPCDGDRDDSHHITSAYRPPLAVVALARRGFETRELSSSQPTYENWKTQNGRSGRDFPEFIETFTIGHHYRLGTLPFGNGGDINGFKMITENSERGVDYFIVGHDLGKEVDKGKPATRSGKFVTSDAGNSNVAQHRNLVIDLTDKGGADFYLLCAPGAIGPVENGVQFLKHEQTWIALTPINLEWKGRHEKGSTVYAQAGEILHGIGKGDAPCGFALEIGEPETHGSFDDFVQAVSAKSKLEGSGASWTYTGSQGRSVGLEHRGGKPGMFITKPDQPWILDRIRSVDEVFAGYPVVSRDGAIVDWTSRFAQYQALSETPAPISLGFKQGELVVEAGGHRFVGSMSEDGTYRFSNE
jgi:hypothetical protein